MDPDKMRFAENIKPHLKEIESYLGDFATYLLENVAACKQSGGSDLFTREDATEVMAYVQKLSNETGAQKTRGTPRDINEALPEILELYGITSAIKQAMEQDLKVDKNDVKRYFELSARAMNFIKSTIEETGV